MVCASLNAQKNEPFNPPPRVPLATPELRRLLVRLFWAVRHLPEHIWRWSMWRSHKQFLAKRAHFKKRGFFLEYHPQL